MVAHGGQLLGLVVLRIVSIVDSVGRPYSDVTVCCKRSLAGKGSP